MALPKPIKKDYANIDSITPTEMNNIAENLESLGNKIQRVGDDTWVTTNADYDGVNWNRIDIAKAATAILLNLAGRITHYAVAAGANPIVWVDVNANVVGVWEYADLSAAVTSIGSNVTTLKIHTIQTLPANLTVPGTLILDFNGTGEISVDSGFTLTVNSSAKNWPSRKVLSGLGAIVGDFGGSYVDWSCFGVIGDGATNDTTLGNKALASAPNILIPKKTYIGEFVVSSDTNISIPAETVLMLPPGKTVGGFSALRISGDDVTIQGDFIVDGDAANNIYSGSSKAGTVDITGNRIKIHGEINIKNAYGDGLSVWNGSDLNSGATPTELYINALKVDNSAGHSAYIWNVDTFEIGRIVCTKGPQSGIVRDNRVRTGTQSSSSLECKNGRIGIVRGAPLVVESRSRHLHISHIYGAGSKVDNGNNILIDKVTVINQDGGSANIFAIGNEFPSIGTTNIYVKQLHIEGCSSTVTERIFTIGGTLEVEDCRIDKIFIKNCTVSICDFSIRNTTRLKIGQCVLISDGNSTRGLYEEGGYPRDEVRIEELHTTGHSSNDIEFNDAKIKVDQLNKNAVWAAQVNVNRSNNLSKDTIITVGPSGFDFTTLAQAIQYANESYRPVFFGAAGFLVNPRVTIEIQAGYIWNESITLDGIDLGWITVTTALAVTVICAGIKCLLICNGGIGPRISGSFDKNNQIENFIQVVEGAIGTFVGTLIGVGNSFCIDVQHGSTCCLQGASITKDPASTASSAAVNSSHGSKIAAQGATVPYASVSGGGIVTINGGTATGGTSVTVNTLNSAGIIFQ